MIKRYKALDLYRLSTRTGNNKYEGLVNQKENIKVKGFVINEQNQKKDVMNIFLKEYSYDNNITKKILGSSYVVGLFKDDGKKKILFLLFGKNKEILEDFNKKITSGKFSKLFDSKIDDKEILLNRKALGIHNFDKKLKKLDFNKNKRKVKDISLKELYLKTEAKDFMTLIVKEKFERKDFIQNEEKINLSLYTLERNLNKYTEADLNKILRVLNQINTPVTINLKRKILNKLNLTRAFVEGKEKREEILQNI